MTHYFLSPHPDDAALSCGGQIASLTQAGVSVVIITTMAGDPPLGITPTAYADKLWARWGLGQGIAATEARREEDRAAAAAMGASIQFWSIPEALYRCDIEGNALYEGHDAIFGEVKAADPVAQALIERDLSAFGAKIPDGSVIHAPLGVGSHVDHQLTRQIGLTLFAAQTHGDLVFYEEFPYSTKGAPAIEAALIRAQYGNFEPSAYNAQSTLHRIDTAALNTKIRAIGCFRSQLSSFWGSLEEMDQKVQDYTAEVGGEREWRFIPIKES